MADAIRAVSLRRGYDPSEYALVAFGGAGGQHACAVAERLGIGTVLVPEAASLLSAVGLGEAVIERFREQQVLERLDRVESDLERRIRALGDAASAAVEAEGVAHEQIEVRRQILNLRLLGQESTLAVEPDGRAPLAELFEQRYVETYGHRPEGRDVEVESIRVVASSVPSRRSVLRQRRPPPARRAPTVELVRAARASGARYRSTSASGSTPARPSRDRRSSSRSTARRSSSRAGTAGSTAPAPSCSSARRLAPRRAARRRSGERRPHAVRLELFTNRFRAIVEEMGEQLRRTAVSTNVKERLDFSCGLLDPAGELVVNAPHIPVHLGALGLCVRRLGEAIALDPGDVVVTNHPDFGGSHLPDVTVVTPVHSEPGALLGFVASRAHHAEIGGVRPGSMPPDATRLVEEGVVLPPTYSCAAARRAGTRSSACCGGGPTPPARSATTWPTCAPPWPPTSAGRRRCERCALARGPRRSITSWRRSATGPRPACARRCDACPKAGTRPKSASTTGRRCASRSSSAAEPLASTSRARRACTPET